MGQLRPPANFRPEGWWPEARAPAYNPLPVGERQLDLPIAGQPGAARAPEKEPLVDPFGDEDGEVTPFEVDPPSEPRRPPVAPRPLPPKADLVERAQDLAEAISRRLDRPVRLSVTDNRSTMVSFQRRQDLLLVRVHHMFLAAPEAVVRAIADYAGRGSRRAGDAIDRYVRENRAAIREGLRRAPHTSLSTRGRFFDLREIFDRLNATYFGKGIDARIGWGRSAPLRGRRRTIRMGVYDHSTRTIRIHPALDRREVPAFFVDYLVFHEMLHQAVPGRHRGRRQQHHGPDFCARERAYPDYERAAAWESENVALLLGKPSGRLARPLD
jgi:hypothetical protein